MSKKRTLGSNSLEQENSNQDRTASSLKGKLKSEYQFKRDSMIAERYKVVSPLGCGGFAEVYHCIDTFSNAQVALKVLLPEQVTPKVLEEAKKTALLREGPHIVVVYDFAKPGAKPFYMSMRLLSGGTLEDRLNKAEFQRLPLGPVTLNILEQVGEALDYAHSMGL